MDDSHCDGESQKLVERDQNGASDENCDGQDTINSRLVGWLGKYYHCSVSSNFQ